MRIPNKRRPSRRQFLAGLAGASAGMAACPLLRGADPVARVGPPRLKLSLSAYSFRAHFRRKTDPLTLEEFVRKGAELNLDAVEPTTYFFTDTADDYLRRLRALAFRLGLDISGTAIGNDFGHPPGPQRDAQVKLTRDWIDRAEILGAPVIRVFAGHRKKGTDEEKTHALMVAGLEECCAYAGEKGIYLALENHGGPTATAAGLLKLVRDVDSPWFGVNLDTGNFRSDDPYADMAAAAPYALNVQVKVALQAGGKKQPADYGRVAKILGDAGYRGYVALEYEAKEDPFTAVPKHIAALRKAIDAAS